MESWVAWAGWGALALVCLFSVGSVAARQRHPLLSVLGCAFCGMAALGIVNLLGKAVTGVMLPLSWLTAFVSVVLGAPGVISLLLLGLLFV